MELKRYEPHPDSTGGEPMFSDPAGDWVRFSDVQALLAQLRGALAEYVHPYQSGTLTERERDTKARQALGEPQKLFGFDVAVDEILPPGTMELRNRPPAGLTNAAEYRIEERPNTVIIWRGTDLVAQMSKAGFMKVVAPMFGGQP